MRLVARPATGIDRPPGTDAMWKRPWRQVPARPGTTRGQAVRGSPPAWARPSGAPRAVGPRRAVPGGRSRPRGGSHPHRRRSYAATSPRVRGVEAVVSHA